MRRRISAPIKRPAVMVTRLDGRRLYMCWFISSVRDLPQNPIAAKHQDECHQENSPTGKLMQESLGGRGTIMPGKNTGPHDSDCVGDDRNGNHQSSKNIAYPAPRRHQITVSHRQRHESHERSDAAASLHSFQGIVGHYQNIAISEYWNLS